MSQGLTLVCYILAVLLTWHNIDELSLQQGRCIKKRLTVDLTLAE